MDKESNQKGKSNVNPNLLTPCRPVGLRRKRSTVNNTSSTSINLSDITSPTTPVNTSSAKSQKLTDHIAPADNVQKDIRESGVKSVENEEQKNMKRKFTSPCGSSTFRRKLALKTASNSPATPSKEDLRVDKNVAISKNEGTKEVLSEDIVTLHRSTVSHPEDISDEFIANREITAAELNALKDRVASKEKKLKEQELAALYKKKHDPKQVAKEIDNWLRGCKEALSDLQSQLAQRGQAYSIVQLLNTLGIPPVLVDIDEDKSE